MTAYPNLDDAIFEHEVSDIASQWKVMLLRQINIHELMLLHCCDIGWLHFSKHSDSNALKNKKNKIGKTSKGIFFLPQDDYMLLFTVNSVLIQSSSPHFEDKH